MKISTLIVLALALAALVYLGLKWHHAGRSNEDLSVVAAHPELSPARLA